MSAVIRLDSADFKSDVGFMIDQWLFIERAAKKLEVGEEAFRKWRVRGVPNSQRLAIVDLAAIENFALDRRSFDLPPGPKTKILNGREEEAA